METILSLLQRLYPEADHATLVTDIEIQIEKLRSVGTKSAPDHQEAVLITYGDSILGRDQMPLRVLGKFATKHLQQAFTTLHILPFFPYSSDDGFSVIDYQQVNPDLGEWSDIAELSTGFKLMFDGVINHISSQSDWVRGYLADDRRFADFFIEKTEEDWSKVIRPRTSALFSSFSAKDGNRLLWTTFSEDQLDLNYANPKVLFRILEVIVTYVERGASFLRLDAIGFLWKEPGTSCMHLRQTHDIVRLIRAIMELGAPHVRLITETNVPHRENISYFGSGNDEAHMVYNFALPPLAAYAILSGDASKLGSWLQTLQQPTEQAYFFNFLASHDGVGVRPAEGILSDAELELLFQSAKANGGLLSMRHQSDGTETVYEINCTYLDLLKGTERDEDAGVRGLVLAHALMLCLPGVPAIYIHSLLGSSNYNEGVRDSGSNRSINRQKLDVSELDAELGRDDSIRSIVFGAITHLLRLKRGLPDLHPANSFQARHDEKGVLSIERGEDFVAHFNFFQKPVEIVLDGSLVDVRTGLRLPDRMELAGLDFVWARVQA